MFQHRPLTAKNARPRRSAQFLKTQWDADQKHAENVEAAEREQEKEQKCLDQKREKERRTGQRPMRTDTIGLEEARRRGYLPSENASSGRPDWYSPGNPDGIFAGGR